MSSQLSQSAIFLAATLTLAASLCTTHDFSATALAKIDAQVAHHETHSQIAVGPMVDPNGLRPFRYEITVDSSFGLNLS